MTTTASSAASLGANTAAFDEPRTCCSDSFVEAAVDRPSFVGENVIEESPIAPVST